MLLVYKEEKPPVNGTLNSGHNIIIPISSCWWHNAELSPGIRIWMVLWSRIDYLIAGIMAILSKMFFSTIFLMRICGCLWFVQRLTAGFGYLKYFFLKDEF